MRLTENFTLDEFKCKDGTEVPANLTINTLVIAHDLEVLREKIGNKPIIINSGYRTKQHNKKVGGAEKSYHLEAKAVDIKAEGMSSFELWKELLELINENKVQGKGLIKYENFVHYDLRENLYIK